MGGFLNKVLLVDLFRRLWATFQNQSPKYIYIEQYPTERPRIAERYRGAPRLNVNPDTNETLCISLQSVRPGVSGKPDCGNVRAERAGPPQGPDDIYLRPITLHVLWAVLGRLSGGRPRIDVGFRAGKLYTGRRNLGSANA